MQRHKITEESISLHINIRISQLTSYCGVLERISTRRCKGKGQAHPTTYDEGPEGSRSIAVLYDDR
jgi:hypothetical protein